MSTSAPPQHSTFYAHLHAFRGMAIVLIVACHAYGQQTWPQGGPEGNDKVNWMFSLSESLLHGSTLYFSLISGLLYSLVLSSKGWRHFASSKINNVFFPYLFFTVLYTLLPGIPKTMMLHEGELTTFFVDVSFNLLTGEARYHLWYIPVLLVLYLLTPLLALLLKSPKAQWFLWPLILAPLLFSRVWPGYSWTTYVYYLGAYAMGLYVGSHYTNVMNWVDKHRLSLIGTTCTVSILTFWCYYNHYTHLGSVNLQESLIYLQKTTFAFLLLSWFREHESQIPKWTNVLGDMAFAIFFIHVVPLQLMQMWVNSDSYPNDSIVQMIFYGTVVAVGGLLLTLFICKPIQYFSHNRSRRIIGA